MRKQKQTNINSGDNGDHLTMKNKLEKRKKKRAYINNKQINAYCKLLELIEGRRAPNRWKKSNFEHAY